MGWERANFFAASAEDARIDYSFGRQNWHGAVGAEHRAVREGAALFDQTSFAKLLVQGGDACAQLNRICAANIDVAIGTTVYTGMLNARGGYVSDLTVLRRGPAEFLLITGSAQAVHDADWTNRNVETGSHVTVTDVTSGWSVLSLMGPKSRAILSALSTADLGNAAFPFGTHRSIDLGYATVISNRMTYVGELGWELIVPTEFAACVYDDLMRTGVQQGMIDAGYYALEGLRIEKGYRAWSRELTPDITPRQAGLGFAVDMDKPGGFIGQDALRAAKSDPDHLRTRIVQLVVEDGAVQLWGGEAVRMDGIEVGEVSSAAYGHTLGACAALCVLRADTPLTADVIRSARFEIDVAGCRYGAAAHLRSAYDPNGARPRADDTAPSPQGGMTIPV